MVSHFRKERLVIWVKPSIVIVHGYLHEQDGVLVGDTGVGNPKDRAARVGFCLNGGRSHATRAVLFALIEAMKKDNDEHPMRE